MRSVYKSDNKYRHPNGLRQQIFLKIFSSCIHTSIRLTEIMSFLNPSYLFLTVTLYSATVWQQMDSSAFIKKKKEWKIKIYTTLWKSSSFIFWSSVRYRQNCFLKTLPHINNSSFHKTVKGLLQLRTFRSSMRVAPFRFHLGLNMVH